MLFVAKVTFWGRPEKKEYKGNYTDRVCHHDLLWTLRVSSENKLIEIKPEDNQPVHAQCQKRIDTTRSYSVRKQLERLRSFPPDSNRSATCQMKYWNLNKEIDRNCKTPEDRGKT